MTLQLQFPKEKIQNKPQKDREFLYGNFGKHLPDYKACNTYIACCKFLKLHMLVILTRWSL
jgi:hypothetical protein